MFHRSKQTGTFNGPLKTLPVRKSKKSPKSRPSIDFFLYVPTIGGWIDSLTCSMNPTWMDQDQWSSIGERIFSIIDR